jgi:hypothetical protein
MATDATQAAGRVADDTNGVDIQLRRELPSFTITVEGPRQQCFTFRYDDFATVLTLRLALCKKLGAEHNDIIVHLRSGSITTSLTDQHSLNNFQMLPAEHRRVHVNISNAAVRQRWDEEFSTPSVGKSDDKAVLNGGRREFACSYGQQSRERYAEGSATIKRSKLQSCTSENDTHLNGAPERVTLRGDAQMDNDGAQQQGSRQPQSVTSIENREWDSGSEVGITRDRSPRPSTHAVIQPGSKAAVKERTAKHLTSMKAKVTQRPRRSKARTNATLTVIPTNNGELRLHRHRSTPTACNNPDFKRRLPSSVSLGLSVVTLTPSTPTGSNSSAATRDGAQAPWTRTSRKSKARRLSTGSTSLRMRWSASSYLPSAERQRRMPSSSNISSLRIAQESVRKWHTRLLRPLGTIASEKEPCVLHRVMAMRESSHSCTARSMTD